MTIDPMAAVTSVTSGAGSAAAGADPVTSTTATPSAAAPTGQTGAQAPAPGQGAVEQGARADLFDYTAKQQSAPPAIETLKPEAQAKYLSNPTALGEKVLERMEGLHQRSIDYHNQVQDVSNGAQGTMSSAGPAGSSEGTMSGPATEHVAGSATSAQPNGYSGLKMMFDYAIESTMISKSSSQFVSSVNTLLKGQ